MLENKVILITYQNHLFTQVTMFINTDLNVFVIVMEPKLSNKKT